MALYESARTTVKSVLLLGISAIALTDAAHAQDQIKAFDVPEQLATTSIPEFAHEANIQILVPEDAVRGKRTRAVHGNFPIHDALNQLLAGIGVKVAADNGRMIVLAVEKKSEPSESGKSAGDIRVQPRQVVQLQVAQAPQSVRLPMVQTATEQVPEQVLVTGTLIHGTVAVGVPVTTLSDADYKETGALTTADLLKSLPSVFVQASETVTQSGGNFVGAQQTEIHGIGGDQTKPKTLLLVDGVRVPLEGTGLCILDPSIIPALAIDRIDVLADGASAIYGSDAIAGVLNVNLKRGYDGAISQFRIADSTDIGGLSLSGSQLFGRKWDSGDVTVTYEYYHIAKIQGPSRNYFTYDFSQFGLDNRTPVVSANPGIVSTGKPAGPANTPSGFSPSFGTTCINCYSIPKGQNGSGLTWAQIVGNPGVGNEYNPYSDAWILPDITRNAAVITFDQDIWRGDGIIQDVQLFGDGFYNNRRNIILSAGTTGATKTNALTQPIPATNPYYPVGAPANLDVSYNFAEEVPGRVTSGSQQGRWEGGFNLDLMANWKGKIFYSKTEDQEFASFSNMVNPNLVNAAVGNTVASNGPNASYTKPANVPYLNLFCDPRAFTCNDPVTLAYISTHRQQEERTVFNEAGATFDGPVFDLPGGPVRLAVGGDYLTNHYSIIDANGSTSLRGDAAPDVAKDAGAYNVWAVFGQLDIPIVGQQNAIPLVQAFEIELSGRIDGYSTVGVTKNPKLAVNWNVGAGLSLRAAAGTSFRAPSFSDLTAAGANVEPLNVPAGANGNSLSTCTPADQKAGHATSGTVAAILDPNCTPALQNLGGIMIGGGSGAAAQVRPEGAHLNPETARNWALGFDFAPADFLKGLDLSATLYKIKITGLMQQGVPGNGLDDPVSRSFFLVNTDSNFANAVVAVTKLPSANPLITPSNVVFIEDSADRNVGWESYEGIDFNGSYDLDLGDFGAWNTGITGNYLLNQQFLSANGLPVFDEYKGRDSGGRLNYRARLGWAGGEESAWSITGFMNYHAHIGNQQAGDNVRTQALPPSCFLAGNPSCASYGPQFGQYTQQYAALTNFEPAWISFDLSLGYKTGDLPANDYLKNLGFQLTINNLLDKRPNFAYITSTSGGTPDAFDRRLDPMQRVVTLVITKVW